MSSTSIRLGVAVLASALTFTLVNQAEARRPQPKVNCQGLSDRYQASAYFTWGKMPRQVRKTWKKMKCTTVWSKAGPCVHHCAKKHQGRGMWLRKGCYGLCKTGKFFKKVGKGIKKGVKKAGKFFKKVGEKIKKGFQKFGNLIKTKVIDKIKAFAMRVFEPVKKRLMTLIGTVIISLSKKIGFNLMDAQEIVDPKTGMYDRAKLQEVVIRKLLTVHLKPVIADKISALIEWGLDLLQKPLDAAVSLAIGALGSIPVAGGVIAGAATAAYSFGIKILRNLVLKKLTAFASKTLAGVAINKLITPLLNKGLNAAKKIGGPLKFVSKGLKWALQKLMQNAEEFFKNWVRHPSKLRPATSQAAPGAAPTAMATK